MNIPTKHTNNINVDLTPFFHRQDISEQIKQILIEFDTKCKDTTFKKGIYIYGAPGAGKTRFVLDLLKEINYDPIKYDAGDLRNKSIIDMITHNNVSRCNVLDMMRGTQKKIAIVMDEIDGMHKGDKGGITALIKLIRQKKTKKQKTENQTMNPIICIGNYYADKKIKELMKVCYAFELKTPTDEEMGNIVSTFMPNIPANMMQSVLNYIQGDIRKYNFIYTLYRKKPDILTSEYIENIFHMKCYNEDYGKIVKTLFQEDARLEQHNTLINDNDRTTVALLWHENIVDLLSNMPFEKSHPLYQRILNNICFADYIDRITFQNQIWIFNEMSSLIKTFYNNKIYHEYFTENGIPKCEIEDVRFTKILTKYSTEYSNMIFLYMLCQELDMDKKDVVAFFQDLRLFYSHTSNGQNVNKKTGEIDILQTDNLAELEKLFIDTDIKKLDVKRIYRYLDKNVKKELLDEEEELEDE